MNEFKPGDLVVRTGPSLEEDEQWQGNQYSVTEVSGSGYIALEGYDGYWNPDRYTLVKREEQDMSATLTTKEAAEVLGVKPPAVMNYVKQDKLHPIDEPSPGRITQFQAEEVEQLAKEKPKAKRKKKPVKKRSAMQAKPKQELVKHPSHYQNGLGVEVIDIINEYFRDNYNLGNVLKYLLRADK